MPGRILIIGAGPAGLGAAWRLKESGHEDFLVVEAEDRVGGLSSSREDGEGFTWDAGGHAAYSRCPYFDEAVRRALPPDAWLRREREAWIRVLGRFVPYPFQYNLHHLPEAERDRCLEGLASRPKEEPRDFRSWIRASFGEGIAELFMLPYNRKIWAVPLEEMGRRWVGERVATVDEARVRGNVLARRDDRDWGGNRTFRYPKRGGTGALWEAVADIVGRGRIRLRCRAMEVRGRELLLDDGSAEPYDSLLNTAPLDLFARSVTDLPARIKKAASGLRRVSTHVVGIGVRGSPPEAVAERTWFYFPEEKHPFYRVCVLSNYSPHNAPEGCWSLMAEASETPQRPVPESLAQDVLRGLRDAELLPQGSRVVSRWRRRFEHGYPVPTLERDAVLDEVQPALESLGVYSRGRFGGWRYEVGNMDHCFMQGAEWAGRMLDGTPEKTYPVR